MMTEAPGGGRATAWSNSCQIGIGFSPRIKERVSMKRLLICLVAGIFVLSAGRLATAGPEDWLVQKTSGSVTFVSGSTSGKLTKGHHVSRGTVVQTGNSGRVLLM